MNKKDAEEIEKDINQYEPTRVIKKAIGWQKTSIMRLKETITENIKILEQNKKYLKVHEKKLRELEEY